MIENGLLGKVVKTDNYHFIGFLYPNFPFVGHLLLFNKEDKQGIIYSGKEHLYQEDRDNFDLFKRTYTKEYLNQTGIPFVSTYSADEKYDIDLTNRETVLDLVYSKWGLDYTQYLDSEMTAVLFDMDEQDFLDFVKFRWLSSNRCSNTQDIGLYNNEAIHKLLNKTVEQVYAEVLAIDSDVTLGALELSIANFMLNAISRNYNPNNKSDYDVTLKNFSESTEGKERELAVILSKYRKMSHNKRIKLIWLITELQKLIAARNEYNANN